MNDSAGESKKRIIFGSADIATRLKARAALPYDDASGLYGLTAEYFYAQPLTVGLATVADRALTFLMSHDFSKFQETRTKFQI
jgi:hypothetical protein